MAQKELLAQEDYQKIYERDEKRAQELYEFLQSSTDKFMRYKNIRPCVNVKEMFESSAKQWPDRPAFLEKPSHKEPYKVFTYADALARIQALGTALHAHGLRGENIAVMGDNGYAWATSYLAICGTGVVVPLDKELTKDEIVELINIGDVRGILYTKKFAEEMAVVKAEAKTEISLFANLDAAEEDLLDFEVSVNVLLAEGQKLLDEGDRSYLDAQIDAEALGFLLFTSGTTGFAKGVMLSQKNICAETMIPTNVMGIVPEDVFFSVLPLHHTYEGTCGFLIPLAQGASIAYCEGLRYIVDNLAEARPTVFLGVPLLFENLYGKIWQNVRKQGKESLLKTVMKINNVTKKIGIDLGGIFYKDILALFGGRMRILIAGGAAIDPAVLAGLKSFGLSAVQGYGLTECSPICALNPLIGGKDASAGYLVPGFEGKIIEADPETGIGEICIRGQNVMMGYYKNEEATAEALQDGWFHTGDYGYIDDENFIFITGRKKNVIITKNGKNVYPEELEYLIARSPLVGELMVWEADSGRNEDTVIAVTILPNEESVAEQLGEDWSEEELGALLLAEVEKMNREVPIFKKVRKVFLRRDPFDITTSKKIRRFVPENKEGREL
ncbi:MAG: AMP-binding protein [Clostridiales Family XIII bacterium]|jgi:long-chain acyl-CoA synthetase|nr:AMP-binding protein [Clostridiales Family XIII bacterium]